MTLALVLLDLQKGIMLSDRIAWDDPGTPRRIVAAAEKLLDGARAANIPVIHVGVERSRRRGGFDSIRTANADKSGKPPRDVLSLAAGTHDVEFVLAPGSGEEIVHKIGVSAFQGTRLDALLRNDGVDDVFVAGAFTHMVVESTVRQGFDLGYRMSVISDACCSPVAGLHDSALSVGIPNFSRIIQVADALERFRRASGDE